MSLSVERLKELYADIEPEENAAAGLVICSAKAGEFAAALRELIAIKEAEPVAYIGNAYGDPVEFAEHELVVTGDIQKIPLFSHLIVRK